MRYEDKTREQLIDELMELRRRNTELEELLAQRKETGEKLRESEEKFSSLAEQSPNMIFISKGGRILYVNEKCEKVMGYRREEFYSPDLDFLSLIAPEYRNTIRAFSSSHIRGEEASPLEYALLTKEGRRIDAILTAKLIQYEGETVILGTVTDIAERKRAEKELQERELRYRNIITQADGVAYQLDWVKQNYTFIDEGIERLTGYTSHEITPEIFESLIEEKIRYTHTSRGNTITSEASHRIGGDTAILYRADYRLRTKDGRTVWAADSSVQLRGFDRKLVGTLGMLQDITGRKRMERKLRESEERYRFLAEKSPLGLSIIGKDGSYKYINDQFKRMFGYTLDDTPTGSEWFQKAYPDEEYRGNVISAWLSDLDSAKSSEPMPRVYSVTCKNGEIKEVLFRPVIMETGDEFVLYEDITERVHTERQLKASLREKEVMLREIHHRVKNNLQVISSLLNMSCMQTENQEAIALLADAQTRVLAMALIHSQLYQTERFDRMDMGILVRSLFAHLANVYATRSRFVTPLILEGTEVFLPITQAIPCSLVLNEVISNIFKHAFKEGQRGTVEISVQNSTNSRIHIRIKDDGVGIPEDIDIHETHSIGLSLIRTLVQDQLEGTVQINRSNGTEFIMEFPKT